MSSVKNICFFLFHVCDIDCWIFTKSCCFYQYVFFNEQVKEN